MLSANFFMTVAFVVIECVQDSQALPPPYPTTTTTTTTTTTASPVVEVGEPVSESGGSMACGGSLCERQLWAKYVPVMQAIDFAWMAQIIDTMCEVDVPAAKQCLREKEPRCIASHTMAVFHILCRADNKNAVKAGKRCWSGGFRAGMQLCVKEFGVHWEQNIDHCTAVATLKSCARTLMETLEDGECTLADGDFIEGFVRDNTLALCSDQ